MAEKHPDELELLSFVEDELETGTRQEVVEHLVACRSCAEQIRRLEAGKAALQTVPLLELPGDRHEAIIAALPERSDRWRLLRPAKRVLVIAAPVAAAAALVGVFAFAGNRLDVGGDDDDAATPAAGEAAQDDSEAPGGGSELAPKLDAAGATLVRSVAGPPAEVVRVLEAAGITARADSAGVVVAEGGGGAVREALADRPGGDVAVYVR